MNGRRNIFTVSQMKPLQASLQLGLCAASDDVDTAFCMAGYTVTYNVLDE